MSRREFIALTDFVAATWPPRGTRAAAKSSAADRCSVVLSRERPRCSILGLGIQAGTNVNCGCCCPPPIQAFQIQRKAEELVRPSNFAF
jgi:hypothetical protein